MDHAPVLAASPQHVLVAKRRGKLLARSERGKLERLWNWEIDTRDGCW